ncbi:MAG: endonuclease/exonuclease/phosphatase family protein [Bacteroidales bacterium]
MARNRSRPLLRLTQILAVIIFPLYLVSAAAWYFDPAKFLVPAYAGLAFPVLFLAAAAITLVLLFTAFRQSLIALLLLIIGAGHLSRLVQFNSPAPVSGKPVKVVSWNLQNFIRENTSTTRWVEDFSNRDSITGWLINQKADIYLIQEFLNDRPNYEQYIRDFGKQLGCPHLVYCNYYKTSRNKIDGLAIFSRYPVINSFRLEEGNKVYALVADIAAGDDTIRFFNIHLASLHLKHGDYRFIRKLESLPDQEELETGTRSILGKMGDAFIRRSGQIKTLSEYLKESPYPVILGGDLNDTPSSWAYRRLRASLNDAFTIAGRGFSGTLANELLPAFRIDILFTSEHFSPVSYQRIKIPFSDHYPVVTTVIKKEE